MLNITAEGLRKVAFRLAFAIDSIVLLAIVPFHDFYVAQNYSFSSTKIYDAKRKNFLN